MYRILVVEDDEVIAKTIRQHLQSWNYEVYAVVDFNSVMEEFARVKPHLVLMDIRLPFHNGFYWCTEIRKVSKLPIIFVSSMNDNMNLVMAINMGGDDFITKLVAGLMIFHIFVLYICGIPAADIRYFAGLELVFFVLAAVFCGIRYWYRLRTVKRQIRDYMQGMQALSDTEDALEEVYMDALEQLQNKRQEEKGAYRNLQREMEEYYALWVHQIKTPISAMRLLLQREEQKQTDPDETAGMEKSVLYDMQQELFWINQYVNMALQYQRMNSGMNDLVLEMVSADQVVRTAIRRFALIMIRKKIAIHYEECREMVLSDEKWLEFVVEQILSNAIKYSGENRAVTIQINRNEADNTCELVISDQGIGIRKEDLPRIFEKGYTGYNGRADKTSTGIGLYLCREITKKLGHGIMITSEIGKGTDVTIVFERNNLDVRD